MLIKNNHSFFNNNRGAAIIGMSLALSVIMLTLTLYLSSREIHHKEEYRQVRLSMKMEAIFDQANTWVKSAVNLARAYDAAGVGACPTGSVRRDIAQPAGAPLTLCVPQGVSPRFRDTDRNSPDLLDAPGPAPSDTDIDDSGFTPPALTDQPLELDMSVGGLVAQYDLIPHFGDDHIDFSVSTQRSFSEHAQLLNYFFWKNLLPTAYANPFDDALPVDPLLDALPDPTNSGVLPVDGGGNTDCTSVPALRCVQCGANNVTCIRLRICPYANLANCATDDRFYSQRIAIR